MKRLCKRFGRSDTVSLRKVDADFSSVSDRIVFDNSRWFESRDMSDIVIASILARSGPVGQQCPSQSSRPS